MSILPQNLRVQIEAVRHGRRKKLDFGSAALSRVPDEIFELLHLEELDLRSNDIAVVPERIRELTNLKVLDLTGNPLRECPDMPGLILDWETLLRCGQGLPPENLLGLRVDPSSTNVPAARYFASFPNLRTLRIGSMAFLGVSAAVERLIESLPDIGSLEDLVFWRVQMAEVPPVIRTLKRLRVLALSHAGLQMIPEWLSELENLTAIYLGRNRLTSLPESLAKLPHLQEIYLFDNPFRELPLALFRAPSLVYVDLTNFLGEGRITDVPINILDAPQLRTLLLFGHPIQTPPPEIIHQGVEAIKTYWRQQQESGTDYLCEAKLLILGEAGAGKTSLSKKIRNPDYQLQDESSTQGIEVLPWNFFSYVRVKQPSGERVLPRDFRVNIWDFGGQEIYHSTHQFFLTRRSLYALVADDRKEDTDFRYWLQVVELLSDSSPLFIVQNEKQDRRRDIDLPSLRARFSNLKGTHRINLADNRGLADLINAISQELERLPHIGTPLPATWKRVREVLEKNPRNYLGLEEYLTICQQHGFTRREDKLQLSGYLHDLGICLHFQDDPVLKHTIILKPRWGTDAVYRVLDDRAVLNNRGRFGLADLARIWAEEEYAAMRHELLRLMMRFQLCYQLPEGDSYIAPQLLSPGQPPYSWDDRANLVLRYEYDFMPKGMLTRFIVSTHHLIPDHALVWKFGVILQREGTRAEIIEDYSRRKITVRISGPDTLGLLAIVDDHLERIHRSFPRLKYDRYLPCNCQMCSQRLEPYAYSLTDLKDFAATGDQIQCRTSRKLVDAAALIRDVLPSALEVEHVKIWQTIPAPESAPCKEIFVSYAWTPESTAVVDQLETALAGRGITLLRDRNELNYKSSIRDFMRRLGRGKAIIVVLSKRYLESPNCMFELTEIANNEDLRKRAFPIVLDDAKVFDPLDRLSYIKHWDSKIDELDTAMRSVTAAHLEGIREDLDLYADIRATIARLTDVFRDMNMFTPDRHKGSTFEAVLAAIEKHLSE
jgi:hypothetical protein